MDPLQKRLHLLSQLKTLSASVSSIQSIIASTLLPPNSDLWDCLLDFLSTASLHTRLNGLYLIDALLPSYASLLQKDGVRVVDVALPREVGREAIWNVQPLRNVLARWKTSGIETGEMQRRVDHVEPILRNLKRSGTQDPLRRIEEDRERHKRLREASWIVTNAEKTGKGLFGREKEGVGKAEFDKAWDETSELNEDDYERMRED